MAHAYGESEDNWHLTAIKALVYPFFLAIFVTLFDESTKIIIVHVQHAFLAFLPILFFRIGKELQLETLGKISALLFLLHPSYFYYPTVIEVTNLFVPLAMLRLEQFIKITKHAQISYRHTLFGIFSGIVILTQPIALVPVVFSILFILRARIKPLIVILASMLLPIVPWTVRNWIVFEKIIPTKSPFYMNFYVGLLPGYSGLEKFQFVDSNIAQKLDSMHKKIGDVQMEAHYKHVFIEAVKKSHCSTYKKHFGKPCSIGLLFLDILKKKSYCL